MLAPFIRIVILIAFGVSAWFFYPKYKPIIEPIIGNPKVLGAQIIHPAIKTINEILPDSIQIPISTPSEERPNAGGEVKGDAVSKIVEEVKQKAEEVAKDQIDSAKEEATKAFCQVLIEKIKNECGQ